MRRLIDKFVTLVEKTRWVTAMTSTQSTKKFPDNTRPIAGDPITPSSRTVIAQDADRQGDIAGVEVQEERGNKADEGAATVPVAGGALGGLTGLLVGLGTLAIPGFGSIVLAGEVATALATTLAGGAIGAAVGSLAGALIGLGIPEERAKVYSDRVAQGQYLAIAV
jgi:hypothetical protein